MTPTGWPPRGDRWAWRVLLAINDQLHAWQHALTLIAALTHSPSDAAAGSLAAHLQRIADAAVTYHDTPWLYELMGRHGHHDSARRWHHLSVGDVADAIAQLRRLAEADRQHFASRDAVPAALDFADNALNRAGDGLAALERQLLATLIPPAPTPPVPPADTTSPHHPKEAATTP